MINVSSQVKIYEVNGGESVPPSLETMTVSSHWNIDNFVVIKVPGSQNTYTVSRRDMEAAIHNAGNSNRHG